MTHQRPIITQRRAFLVAGCGCLGLLLAGLVWVLVTGLIARSDLRRAQAELPQLRKALLSGDVAKARVFGDHIRSNAGSAHSLVSGPAWWVAAHLPGVGTPLQTSRAIASAADRVGTQVVPGVVQLGETIRTSALRQGDSINLTVLAQAQPVVDRSGRATQRAMAELSAAPRSSWLSSVDSSRASLIKQLAGLRGELAGASQALRTAIPMLGAEGPRRYFVGFLNEAESRGLGGVPGAFAIVTADHGTIKFTHFGNDNTLNGIRADVDLGADYNAMYGSADPTGVFANSDISPDFRDAAQIWASMWQKKSGEHIDGAIAVDPTALSHLLRVSGPAPLPGGGAVTADNVVSLTQQKQYSMFSDKANRKKFVVDVADAISKRITAGAPDTIAFLHAIAHGARERRIVVWSSQPVEEQELITAGYAGTLPSGAGPVTGFVTVNSAGSKLDYYVERSITYRQSGCGTDRTATATITLRNTAPRSGLPRYVTLRGDNPRYETKPGDTRMIFTYYASRGATVESVSVNGKTVSPVIGTEQGLTTAQIDLELPVHQARTIVVQLSEPGTSGAATVLVQPSVRATSAANRVGECASS
jgi:hypothetical protein